MKKFVAMLAVVLPLALVVGCEPFPDSDEDEGKVEFVNKSSYRVSITPESRGWSGFSLAPDERKTINDLYDVYFSYEPRFRVKVGKNDAGRVVFVNGGERAVEVDSAD